MTVCTAQQKHQEPVHFNRGRHGNVWICTACGSQLGGPTLEDEEIEALVEFTKCARIDFAEKRAKAQKERQMQLEIKVLAGAESKAFLADLTKQIDRLERLGGTKTISTTVTGPAEPEAEEEEEFAAKPPKAKASAKAAGFDDDADDAPAAPAEPEEEEEDFTTPPAKTAKPPKAKKVTLDDVNDACKAKAKSIGGKAGREKVLVVLTKHFKTESVSELKPEQWAKCIELMAV